jgi:hypothetical protein
MDFGRATWGNAEQSRDRIDGAVASAMAVARAAAGDSSSSIYSNVEERPAGPLFV